jgi:hypothetical protein
MEPDQRDPIRVIGFAGLAGSGKSSIAAEIQSILREDGKQAILTSFAAPLKIMLAALIEAVEGEFDSAFFGPDKETPISDALPYTPRKLMQTLGTEWGRHQLDPLFWTRIWQHRVANLRPDKIVLIDDVRFPTEINVINDMVGGGKVFYIKRPGVIAASNHSSEHDVSDMCDDTVYNDSSLRTIARYILHSSGYTNV